MLEVGAGCGYAAAVLGALAARVISVEIIPGLAALARANLRRTGRDGNVTIVAGRRLDGLCREGAPYDAISVAAGAPGCPGVAARAAQRSGPPGDPGGRPRTIRSCGSCRKRRRPDRVARRDAVPLRAAARRRGLELMRLRTAKDRLKIEHSIIDGVRRMLEELLQANAEIRSVIPGVIRPVRDARGKVQSARHGADAERLEGDRAERGRPAGAVHQHRLDAGAGGGGIPARRRLARRGPTPFRSPSTAPRVTSPSSTSCPSDRASASPA